MNKTLQIGRKSITVPETIIDRVVSWIDPVRGQRRFRARAAMAISGGYTGASKSKRSMTSWTTGGADPDTDILYDLPTLRDRSRDLIRNAPLALGAINTAVTNVVGSGLKLQARIDRTVLKISDEQAELWEANTEYEFNLWAQSQECDVARTLTFGDIQKLAFLQTLENGESFALLPRFTRGGFPYATKIQLIEADRVSNPDNKSDTDTLVAGIEKDSYGAPVRYHITKQHPGNMRYASVKAYQWESFPAFGAKTGLRNVIHLFDTRRPGQTRGVPYLAPVIESLKMLDRYTEAELMAAVVSGMFTVFVETESGANDLSSFLPKDETNAQTSDEDYKLGNGAIVGMAKGEKISTANPGRPNAGFDPFVKAILQHVGVALEIPYEVLIQHFSSSYSASRAALLEAWRFFRNRRAWLATNFCQIVYENWLSEAVALGRVNAPGFFRDHRIHKAYTGTLWIGDAPGQLDPLKEVTAAERRIEMGISTLDAETVALTGGDFEQNYPRIVKERALMEKIGMWQRVSQKNAAAAPVAQAMHGKPAPDQQEADDNETA
ncbi:phage portal protein [Candidatus Pacearchaeota archaeon]|jgi:lambda family phage portal protein|nr:phage portal protein [Candidatus Pacearchaeota archaeon]